MTQPRKKRRAGRVIVVASRSHVLLLHGNDPTNPNEGSWWITPGGGLEPGESTADAARRELAEETGFLCEPLSEVVFQREAVFEFHHVIYEQSEDFYLVHIDEPFAVDTSAHSQIERQTLFECRWWPIEELRATSEAVFPENLPDLLAAANRQG